MLQQLFTLQGEKLGNTPWQEYPRPLMKRESYVNLNGSWEFVCSQSPVLPEEYPDTIQVPFCPESALSGRKMPVEPGSYLYYRRRVEGPFTPHQGRVLLHIGAADQLTQVYVNGDCMGSHVGGYNCFSVDVTSAWQRDNEIVIVCYDDLRDQSMPYGKQRLNRGGMWYTPVSGIWQTVWLEYVPEEYIQKLQIRNRGMSVVITTQPAVDGEIIVEGLGTYPLRQGEAVITPDEPRMWSPEDPYLYNFTLQTGTDRVESYFAIRSLEVRQVDGIPRLCLNGQPYFFHGLLDQGYWPDGIYTPAAPECYEEDILAMKELGFNTLRKHIKVEPEAFYHACDRLGMIVFQDMVNNGDYSFLRDTILPTFLPGKIRDQRLHKDPQTRYRFLEAMEQTVEQLGSHGCIVLWTIFNEGWGQFDADGVYEILKKLDDSRWIDATSGWFRQKKSDVDSRHIYFTSWRQLKAGDKPLLLSEFGGFACPVKGHLFNTSRAYGYRACKSISHFQKAMEALYLNKVLPAAERGLCGAICTQVSDVEDEINGFVTYDRKVRKGDKASMQKIARLLEKACK